MKSKSTLIAAGCLAALLCGGPSLAFAQFVQASPSPSASPESKSTRAIPFRGTASAVDQAAKSFTIAGKESSRVFKVTEKTAVTKEGKSATLSDLSDNDKVTGSYWKQEDGSLLTKSLKIGGKATSEKETKKSTKADAADAASPAASPSPSPKKKK